MRTSFVSDFMPQESNRCTPPAFLADGRHPSSTLDGPPTATHTDPNSTSAESTTPKHQSTMSRCQQPAAPGKAQKNRSNRSAGSRPWSNKGMRPNTEPQGGSKPCKSRHIEPGMVKPLSPESAMGYLEQSMQEVTINTEQLERDSSKNPSPSQPTQSVSPQFTIPSAPIPHFYTSQVTDCSQETTLSQLHSRRFFQEFAEVRELGRGYFGRVALVQEAFSGDLFAIKECAPTFTKGDELRRQLERNILALARGLPHCLTLYNAWTEGHRRPQLYLQLQYCPNGSVERQVHYRRTKSIKWPEAEVVTFLGQMALALHALHRNNIVHVDFKPDNVLLDEKHNFVLADFGCALVLHPRTGRPLSNFDKQEQVTQRRGFLVPTGNTVGEGSQSWLGRSMDSVSQDEGDCRYVSIDMMNEKRHYKAGDIFSLGISLYELMSGNVLPNNGPTFQSLRSRTELNELLERGYSESLVQLTCAMMNRDPLQRPTADDILRNEMFAPQPIPRDALAGPSTNSSPLRGLTPKSGDNSPSDVYPATRMSFGGGGNASFPSAPPSYAQAAAGLDRKGSNNSNCCGPDILEKMGQLRLAATKHEIASYRMYNAVSQGVCKGQAPMVMESVESLEAPPALRSPPNMQDGFQTPIPFGQAAVHPAMQPLNANLS